MECDSLEGNNDSDDGSANENKDIKNAIIKDGRVVMFPKGYWRNQKNNRRNNNDDNCVENGESNQRKGYQHNVEKQNENRKNKKRNRKKYNKEKEFQNQKNQETTDNSNTNNSKN